MAQLTSRQRAHLKSLAHPLKPLIQVGKEGVSAALVHSVDNALGTHELLKVKLLESSPHDVDEAAGIFRDRLAGAHVVQVIGRTVVLYREHPEKPAITLPGR